LSHDQPVGDVADRKSRQSLPKEKHFRFRRTTPRLYLKTVVYARELGSDSYAVTERALKAGPIKTSIGRVPVEWVRESDGTVRAVRTDTSEALVPARLFWFAWFTFHRATGLHDVPPRKRAPRAG